MRFRRTRVVVGVLAAVAAVGTGCTLFVDFVDKPLDAVACDGGDCVDGAVVYGDPDASVDAPAAADDADPCVTLADGASCGDADPCNARPTCVNGACAAHPREAGTYCDYLGGCSCGYCNGSGACTATKRCPEGFNWDSKNKLARCCAGLAVLTDTNANCGVCGVICKTAGVANPQSCKQLDGEYLCVGCTANSECWSKCCSGSPAPSHCAPSDCSAGACPAGICPAPSTCIPGAANAPNYCSY